MRRRGALRRMLGLCVALAAAGPAVAAEPLLGPAPRADDGGYENFVGEIGHGGPTVRIPFFFRRIGGAFRTRKPAPSRVENDGAFLRENALHSEPTVTWVGHATLLVQMDHATFLTDPIWSKTPSPVRFAGPRRFVPPGVALEDLPPIDFVVVSHNHYDHLDVSTLRKLAERNADTLFLVPLGNGELLRKNDVENVRELDWGDTAELDGLTIHCLPAQHWSQRSLRDRNRTLWASWAVTGPTRRFYFAGDTGAFDGHRRIGEALGPFDLAAVPIGAYLPEAMMREAHLNPEEAAQASADLRARRTLGMHFGTFDLSDEPLDEPPARFRPAAAQAGFAPEDVWILAIGETRLF